MANTRSAAKQARKSSRLRLLNKKAGDELRQAAKKIKNLVKEGLKDEATALLKGFQSMVDKAAKKGRLKKNTAVRRTSRIAKLVKSDVKVVAAKAKRSPKAAPRKAAAKKTTPPAAA